MGYTSERNTNSAPQPPQLGVDPGNAHPAGAEKPDIPAISGIQVHDRAVYILSIIAARPHNLSEVCDETGLPRATAHRISVALEKHRLIERQADGQWTAGPALAELAPRTSPRLEEAAEHLLPKLVEQTKESVQVYQLSGFERLCVANAEPATGLRDTVPRNTRMTLNAGSAARILVAWAPASLQQAVLPTAAYSAAELERVRQTQISESVAERDASLASASVPIFDSTGTMVAALSVSGPVARMGDSPAEKFGDALRQTAKEIEIHL